MKYLIWSLPILLALLLVGCKAAKKNEPAPKTASLQFHSFDGGGPRFDCRLDDPELVGVESRRDYDKENHEELTGAGYTVTFTFTGKKPGQTLLTVTSDSPIAPEPTQRYTVTVDEALNVTLTHLEEDAADLPLPSGNCVLAIETQQSVLTAVFADGPDREACIRQLNGAAAEIALKRCEGGFCAELPWEPVGAAQPLAAEPGGVILREDGKLFLCLEQTQLRGVLLAELGELGLNELEKTTEQSFQALLWLEWDE